MKELHVEGVATHDDPESCGGAREDAAEALTGARTGRVSSREISLSTTPTLSRETEGNTTDTAIARWTPVGRGHRPLARTEPFCARTGRSPHRPRTMAPRAASGRLGADSR